MRESSRHVLALCSMAALLLIGWADSAVGTPALDEPFGLVQPNGSRFIARQGGDEWLNWVSHEGNLIVKGDDGWWRYGQIVADKLVSTQARVGADPAPHNAATTEHIARLSRNVPSMPEGALLPPRGPGGRANQPILVILVEFSDRSISTDISQWADLFFGTSGRTVRTYFGEVSKNTFTFYEVYESYGATDGVVKVNLGYPHPDPGSTIGDDNREIVYDALVAANSYINFSSYDLNFDGGISSSELHIATIVAGYERGYSPSYSPSVWGHRWSLGFGSVSAPVLDGKSICNYLYGGGYTQDGELHGNHMATMGVPCHEMGHDLGLIDLYDTDVSSAGAGGHGLMGYGGWGQAAGDSVRGMTPTHLCPWSKIEAGLVYPTLIEGNGYQFLYAASSASYNILKIATTDANQYFLVENRQLTGYDAGLYAWFDTTSGGSAGGGLAIWHIDESMADNDNELHKKVDLEEANEGSLGYSELDLLHNLGNRHHLYYAGHVNHFGDDTTPSSKLYNGAKTYLDISSISGASSTMNCYIVTEPVYILNWSTFLGHNEEDRANDVAVDDSGYAYVTGFTYSDSFPTTPGAYQNYNYNYCSVFVTKFDLDGDSLIYSTFLNGGSSDIGTSIAVDGSGNAYVTGYTYSVAFPTTPGAYDRTHNGNEDIFVTKLNADGNNLIYSTFIGGGTPSNAPEKARAIAIDASGNAYVTGNTSCTDYPTTPGAYDRTHNGDWDAFVTKLNAAGSALSYSTYLGGSTAVPPGNPLDEGRDIAVDVSEQAYVVGWTLSTDFPTTPGAYDQTLGGIEDAFVCKLNAAGSARAYCTFLGGSYGSEEGFGIALNQGGNAYVTGWTSSSNFPTTEGAYSRWMHGYSDAFLTKFNAAGNGIDYSSYLGGTGTDRARGIDLDDLGNVYLAGNTESNDFPYTSGACDTTYNGGLDVFQARFDPQGNGQNDLLFSTYFGGSNDDSDSDFPPAVAVDDEGNVYVAGATNSTDFPTSDGAYDETYNGGSRDAFAFKISMGIPTDVQEGQATDATPTNFQLLQNYPNPFNSSTTIQYLLPTQSHVRLTIYNLLGQLVVTLVDEHKRAGLWRVNWNAGSLCSGVYFCRIQAGDFSETRSMILIR